MLKTIITSLLIFLSILLGHVKIANADTPALNFASLGAGQDYTQGTYSLGWSFTTKESVTVTALGFYDSLKDGLTESHDVGIFNAADCQLLAMTTVTSADTLNGFFRYHNITPVILPAGGTYYASAVTGSEPYAIAVSDLIVHSAINFGGFASYGSGFTQSGTLVCSNSFSEQYHGDFGPSFLIQANSQLVTPKTQLTVPPVVTQIAANKITLTLELFTGVGTLKNKVLRALTNSPGYQALKASKSSFVYNVEVKRTNDAYGKQIKNDIRNLTSKRNTLTVASLKPGSYAVRYRVEVFTGNGSSKKSAGKTKFSPSAKFTIG